MSVVSNFYRIVLNQSLYDIRKVIMALDPVIDNNLPNPEIHEKELKTVKMLVDTYLSVVPQLESDKVSKNDKSKK